MRVVDGALIADNEDLHLPPNELHITEVEDVIVFRVVTTRGHLFAKAIGKHEPEEAIREVGAIVVAEAELDMALGHNALSRYLETSHA